MKLIPLTNHYEFVYVDNEDYELLSKYKWRFQKGYAVRTDFASCSSENKSGHHSMKTILLHKAILGGSDAQMVDHIDTNRLNCQKYNLRYANPQLNSRNKNKRSDNNSSKYKGVHWNTRDKTWVARIQTGKKRIHLGCYKDQKEAALAYNISAVKHFGEFARLNLFDIPSISED